MNASRIEYLEWLTERSFRVGRFHFGTDALIGLIPFGGDVLTGLLAAYIVVCAARDGVPRATLARMSANVLIDVTLGAVPIIGDAFDVLFRANTRNLRLYRAALAGRHEPAKDWGFVAAVAGGMLAVVAVPVLLLIALIGLIF